MLNVPPLPLHNKPLQLVKVLKVDDIHVDDGGDLQATKG